MRPAARQRARTTRLSRPPEIGRLIGPSPGVGYADGLRRVVDPVLKECLRLVDRVPAKVSLLGEEAGTPVDDLAVAVDEPDVPVLRNRSHMTADRPSRDTVSEGESPKAGTKVDTSIACQVTQHSNPVGNGEDLGCVAVEKRHDACAVGKGREGAVRSHTGDRELAAEDGSQIEDVTLADHRVKSVGVDDVAATDPRVAAEDREPVAHVDAGPLLVEARRKVLHVPVQATHRPVRMGAGRDDAIGDERVVNAVRLGGAGRLALVGPHGEERHPVEPIFLPLAKMETARLVCGRITRPRVAVDENARAKSELRSDAQVTARSRTRESIARALRRLAASPRSGRGCACRGRARVLDVLALDGQS